MMTTYYKMTENIRQYKITREWNAAKFSRYTVFLKF